MKYLIIYYSRTGKNKKIAESINEKINSDIEEIIDLRKRKGLIGWLRSGMDASLKRETKIKSINYDPSNYDSVIIGTPVWTGNITPAIRTYLNKNKDKIKKYSIFSVSGFGEKNRKISNIIASILNKNPITELYISEREFKKLNYLSKINYYTNKILSNIK